jgi:hypothetical protein
MRALNSMSPKLSLLRRHHALDVLPDAAEQPKGSEVPRPRSADRQDVPHQIELVEKAPVAIDCIDFRGWVSSRIFRHLSLHLRSLRYCGRKRLAEVAAEVHQATLQSYLSSTLYTGENGTPENIGQTLGKAPRRLEFLGFTAVGLET